MRAGRSWALVSWLAVAACSKAAGTAPVPSGPAGDEPPKPLPQAPPGVLVRGWDGECSTLPCAKGECRVACPPREDMLSIDIVEPLLGKITVHIEGAEVASKVVREMPTTGCAFSVKVRPLRWPAHADVQVDDLAGSVQIEKAAQFVQTTNRDRTGPLTFRARSSRFMYE